MLFSTSLVTAQSKATKKADKHFARFEYTTAISEYLKVVEKKQGDSYVYKQLADSYYNVFNSKEAVKWYQKAVKETPDAETHFRYAQMLKAQGKYEDANQQMSLFASKSPSDTRAVEFKSNPNYLPKLQDKKKLYDVTPLDISSDKSDFGAILYKDGLYFASARNATRKTFKWTDEPYLDIYRANVNQDGSITNPEEVKGLNTQWHDGPVVFTADGNTAYYATETFNQTQGKGFEKDKETNSKIGNVSIYKATMVNGQWDNKNPLPFSSIQYATANPSLSRDGKTLYFSSNMPGGMGGNDIWKVTINQDGSFGTPQNMGNKVNTPGDESFPYISDDNKTLYFASRGHLGFGGYDVFMADLAKIGAPVNLGKPINSEKDDFSFSFNSEKNIAFLASNRSGIDNLYKAIPVCGVNVNAVVVDAKSGQPLQGASVSIIDAKKNVIMTQDTDSKGGVNYYVECDKGYTLQVVKSGYEGTRNDVLPSKGESRDVTLSMQPIEVIVTLPAIVLNEVFFEYDQSNITAEGAFELDKLVQVMTDHPEMVIMVKAHTDNRGEDKYNQRLSERRAKSTLEYVLSKGINKDRITAKGYGESEPKVDCAEKCTEEEYAENRRSEFLIIKK
jgi:outer membrane protein OmpA-like peptidoglycan-associated protein